MVNVLQTVNPILLFLALTAPAAAREENQPASGARYVAMGSSFASGSGVAPYAPSAPARCQRSTRNYAQLLAKKLDLYLVDVTCGGRDYRPHPGALERASGAD
ncbi:hypothetical protein GCM10011494_35930 [Novosphingobium endophyticum]|uniref:SGNH hydrolase-type esterase domain-containing protein n=1 Tax=Novosphingobium endophyticum TaxID=1955250 RepID=A0A916TXX1_9SPHN|nr:hypothetical protein GCM10011494_35930 [Novosphingobium endophyticum]